MGLLQTIKKQMHKKTPETKNVRRFYFEFYFMQPFS